jgi:glycosyltransferase involved in cell wall biosynthesis
MNGISVIICCYNSANRLAPTLYALHSQQDTSFPWELIVVDNASTDQTATVARRLWPSDAPAPLRIVSEPEPGLSHARKKGLASAKFDVIAFVDDDNWLASDWLRRAHKIFADNPTVAACGGQIIPHYETPAPPWFAPFERSLAVGRQAGKSGVTQLGHSLWGAGLALRKSTWDALQANGFNFRTEGRKGAQLSSAEDMELSLALQMAGWQLWYEDSLILTHFIPAGRCTWSYIKKLAAGYARSAVLVEPYGHAMMRGESFRETLKPRVAWQIAALLVSILRKPHILLRAALPPSEGNSQYLLLLSMCTRAAALLSQGRNYHLAFHQLRQASWNSPRISPIDTNL